jgi:hypothetical protein
MKDKTSKEGLRGSLRIIFVFIGVLQFLDDYRLGVLD